MEERRQKMKMEDGRWKMKMKDEVEDEDCS